MPMRCDVAILFILQLSLSALREPAFPAIPRCIIKNQIIIIIITADATRCNTASKGAVWGQKGRGVVWARVHQDARCRVIALSLSETDNGEGMRNVCTGGTGQRKGVGK